MAAFMQLLLSMASRNCGKMTAGVDIPTQTGVLLAKPLNWWESGELSGRAEKRGVAKRRCMSTASTCRYSAACIQTFPGRMRTMANASPPDSKKRPAVGGLAGMFILVKLLCCLGTHLCLHVSHSHTS
jgi:hypothetical protein